MIQIIKFPILLSHIHAHIFVGAFLWEQNSSAFNPEYKSQTEVTFNNSSLHASGHTH